MPNIVTRRVTRDKLMAAMGGSHELVKLLESLINDVAGTLPEMNDDTLRRLDSLALGVFGQREAIPPSVRVADFLTIAPDAAGYTLGLDLVALLAAIRAFSPHPEMPGDVRAGDFLDVTRDAAGYVVGLDMGQLVLALATILPRQSAPPPANDAQAILANRIFRS